MRRSAFLAAPLAAVLVAQAIAPARAEMHSIPVMLGAHALWPAACSDGRRLAFMMNAKKSTEIFVLDLADTTRTPIQITDSPKADGKPSWSPDGSRFAFMSGRSGDEDIWVCALESREYTQMTFSHEGPGLRAQEWGPAWSPDGSRIAFSSDRSGDDDIWWVPGQGGEPTRVTRRTLARSRDQDRYPAWSPDGKKIVYASMTSGNWDLWVATVDDTSSRPLQITADTTGEWSPAWSPNGRWIAFVSDRAGNLDLFVMPAAGGAAVQLTKNLGNDDTPCWSPDGRKIYYASTRDEDEGIWAIGELEETLGPDFARQRK